jgi:hypothetical protein
MEAADVTAPKDVRAAHHLESLCLECVVEQPDPRKERQDEFDRTANHALERTAMSAGSVLVAFGCRWRAHVSRSAWSFGGTPCATCDTHAMNTQQIQTPDSSEIKAENTPEPRKKRTFGVGFWLVLLASLIVTAAICVEFIQPGTLSRMADDISEAAKRGARQLIIVVFWKVVVPAYFIFYTALPIVLFFIIRKMRSRIAALEARR